MRLSTWGIRDNWGPFRNVSVGGRHIHHFVPGILIAFASGTAALLTDNDELEQHLAVPMGIGIGLTFDEAALLLDLRDVYWTREGLLSVQLSLGATAILSIAILTLRMLRRGERRQEQEGLIPPADDISPPELALGVTEVSISFPRHLHVSSDVPAYGPLVCLEPPGRSALRCRRVAPYTELMPQPTSTHVPPQNIEAEESVLGAMLVAEPALTRVIDEVKLNAADFYLDRHRAIFECAHDLYADSKPVDELSVARR